VGVCDDSRGTSWRCWQTIVFESSVLCTPRLDELLPPKSDSQHNLSKRRHNLTLPEKKGHLAAKNFIVRLLYKDTYWLPSRLSYNLTFSVLSFSFFLHYYSVAFSQLCFYNKNGLEWNGYGTIYRRTFKNELISYFLSRSILLNVLTVSHPHLVVLVVAACCLGHVKYIFDWLIGSNL